MPPSPALRRTQSTIAQTPNCPQAQEHHQRPPNLPSHALSRKGELTCQGYLTGHNDQPRWSSSAFLSSELTMMDEESESEGEVERPLRAWRRWRAIPLSRSVSPKTTYIPNRPIPSVTHARPDENPDGQHHQDTRSRPAERSIQSSSAFGS
jgi:hypothetical protein